MNSSEISQERVPGFVYLDMEKVKSISSRLDEGYIKEKVEEKEEEEKLIEGITGSIRASIFGIGGEVGGESTQSTSTGTRTAESKALHHYYFDLLEDWLGEHQNEWFYDVNDMASGVGGESAVPSRFRDTVEEGDIIRVRGPLAFQDFKNSLDILESYK